jgi:hypothetical protein
MHGTWLGSERRFVYVVLFIISDMCQDELDAAGKVVTSRAEIRQVIIYI